MHAPALATRSCAALLALLACACTPSSTALEDLLVREIHASFPDYEVVAEPDGHLCVHRPFRRDVIVDEQAFAAECQAGPGPCDERTRDLLLSLR
ncbi:MULTISPECIES: hypothetical protein [Ramlibacter]|uniref:Uncharacterized protein n=1 Tax=Ramlibacter aquaticus TaxID=2780094 RepID=A0ABR9S9N3_9BURK|nr:MULTISPECIES: hypothetical protein [Ramlibacter]MBE7938986.1 hypothetical protein [Ramlibacter aquaticus]